jgi:hypothetical protein
VLLIARHRVLVLAFALLGGAVSACGSKQSGGGPSGVLVATQRLQGNWRVVAFVPEAQLEVPLQGLLNAELGQLTVSFNGSNYTAVGPGINVSGRYQLDTAEGELLSGSFFDSTGVAYHLSGQFQGTQFGFRSYDSPWRGTGTLQRAQ